MKNLTLILIAFLSVMSVKAQITLDQNDFLTPAEYTLATDYTGSLGPLDFGTMGANDTYNFTALDMNNADPNEIETLDYLPAQLSPYAAEHPTASLFRLGMTELSTQGDTVVKIYQFFDNTALGSFTVGYTSIVDSGFLATLDSDQGTGNFDTFPVTFNENDLVVAPYSYGTSHWDTTAWSVQANNLDQAQNISYDVNVVGHGTIHTSLGTYPALKVHMTEITHRYLAMDTMVLEDAIDTSYYIQYWVEHLGHPIVMARCDDNNFSPTTDLEYILNCTKLDYQFIDLCQGDSVFVGGAWQTTSGTYTDQGAMGGLCDTLHLTVLNVVGPADAGVNNSGVTCDSISFFDLTNLLSAFADAGGTWTDDDNTGALNGSIFDPMTAGVGVYDFTYTVVGPGACGTDQAVITVTVDACMIDNINEITSADWNVYPNPANAQLTISLDQFEQVATAKIYDAMGREVQQANIFNSTTQVDLTQLTPGIYFVNLFDQNGQLLSGKKVIVQR